MFLDATNMPSVKNLWRHDMSKRGKAAKLVMKSLKSPKKTKINFLDGGKKGVFALTNTLVILIACLVLLGLLMYIIFTRLKGSLVPMQ